MKHLISIETKYCGPTNTKGSLIKTTCSQFDKSKSVFWDYALNPFDNHLAAAKTLAAMIEPCGELVSFSETNTGYSFHFKFASDKE
jgi:hypothetical protein